MALIAFLSFTKPVQRADQPFAATPLYLDIEPQPRVAAVPTRDAISPAAPRIKAPVHAPRLDMDEEPAPVTPAVLTIVQPQAAPPTPVVQPPSLTQRDAIARTMRQGLSDCTALIADERQACLDRRTRWARNASPISGTGSPERDAALARQGARRLATWEAQRAEPPRGDPPCETPHPMAGCEGVNIQVDLFSSRDGFLPNLRKRRE
nr:hypothetical protein [uncultured Brevundimonas sp.]